MFNLDCFHFVWASLQRDTMPSLVGGSIHCQAVHLITMMWYIYGPSDYIILCDVILLLWITMVWYNAKSWWFHSPSGRPFDYSPQSSARHSLVDWETRLGIHRPREILRQAVATQWNSIQGQTESTGSLRKNGKSKTVFMGTKFHEKLTFSAFFSRELATNLRSWATRSVTITLAP